MANDREVLRLVWEGKIPICFQADPAEVVGLQPPEPFYLMVPRLSYLPLVTDKVRKHFVRFIANEQQEGDIWFDCNGTPLKWHYPIGVLFDLTMGDEEPNLPWSVTIHFGHLPGEYVFKSPTKEVVEAHFMSCLKEADHLKHRGQIVSAMQKKDHTQLWLGFVNDKFDQFWAVNRRLMESHGDQDNFKYIPVRCYNEDGTFVQKLIQPTSKTSLKQTLKDLLESFSSPARRAVAARMHGITVDLDTPLQWLSEHLSYPDNFLHICLLYDDDNTTIAADNDSSVC